MLIIRLVFTENERQVVSPAYEQFVSNLQDLCSVDEGDVRFLGSRVDLAFPQRFRYPRTDELVCVSVLCPVVAHLMISYFCLMAK